MVLCKCGKTILSGCECHNCRIERVVNEQDEKNKQYRESKKSVTVDSDTARRYSNTLFVDAT